MLQCPTKYEPVCGSDDITYKNKCHLVKIRNFIKHDLHVQYDGECKPIKGQVVPPDVPNPHLKQTGIKTPVTSTKTPVTGIKTPVTGIKTKVTSKRVSTTTPVTIKQVDDTSIKKHPPQLQQTQEQEQQVTIPQTKKKTGVKSAVKIHINKPEKQEERAPPEHSLPKAIAPLPLTVSKEEPPPHAPHYT